MRLDSFSNTNNTESSWTEKTSIISRVNKSFNNFINIVRSLVNNFTGVKNSSSEFECKSYDSSSYSSQPQKFPGELRKVSLISSEGMTLTSEKSLELARSTSVKSERAILNEKQSKTRFNLLCNSFFKFSMPTFWQKNSSSANNNVEQKKIATTKIAEVTKGCVEKAMHSNIAGICANLNQHITDKNVEGIFRGEPNKAIYNKDDNSKLINVFSNESFQSEPIPLSWMVKTYLGDFFPKVNLKQLDWVIAQEDFDSLINEKINVSGSEEIQNNLKACFGSMAAALRLVEHDQDIQGLTKSSIVTSMLPRMIAIAPENFISYNTTKDMITDLMANYLIKYH